ALFAALRNVRYWHKADTTMMSAFDPQEPSCTDGGDLLRRDMIGAAHVTPKLDLALEHGTRRLARLLIIGVTIHATVAKRLAQLCVCKAGAQCSVQFVDDRARRPGRCQQHMPEINIELLVAELGHGLELRQAGERFFAYDRVGFELAGIDQWPRDDSRDRP